MKTWQALKAADEGKKIRRKCWMKGVYSIKEEKSRFGDTALVTHYKLSNKFWNLRQRKFGVVRVGRYFRNGLGNIQGGIMIIIQAEDGAIIADPKEIYIDKALDGHLHIYADLSSTDRVKAVKLTVFDYSKEDLEQMLEKLYQKMYKWLFMNECPHYVIRMKEVLNRYMEGSHD